MPKEMPGVANPMMEQPEKKEEEVVLRVIVARHGPKASASGEKDARAAYFGEAVQKGFSEMDLVEGQGLVHVNTSPADRAVKTGEIHAEELTKTDHRQKTSVALRKSLGVPYGKESEAKDERFARDFNTIVTTQKAMEPVLRERVVKECPDLPPEQQEALIRNGIDRRILERLFAEDDPKWQTEKLFEVSYQESADIFASRYLGFLRHTEMLKNTKEDRNVQPQDEPYISVDVSHSFPAMSFLKKYLVFIDESGDRRSALTMSPQEFFDRTGGVIRESQSFTMDYVLFGDRKTIRVSGEFEPGKRFEGNIDLELLRNAKNNTMSETL